MNSADYSGYISTPVRKTQVVTLYMRQLQMTNFYNSVQILEDGAPAPADGKFKTPYIGLGHADFYDETTEQLTPNPWSDPNDSDISDTFPPIPSETMTELEPEFIGMQKCTWKRYAKPYVAPTTAEKDDANTVYYKGLYYKTTPNEEEAIQDGYTAVMFLMTADSDTCFTTGLAVRQVGLFMGVNRNSEFIAADAYSVMSDDDKGHLIAVQNMMPITRQDTQLEKYYFLIQF